MPVLELDANKTKQKKNVKGVVKAQSNKKCCLLPAMAALQWENAASIFSSAVITCRECN